MKKTYFVTVEEITDTVKDKSYTTKERIVTKIILCIYLTALTVSILFSLKQVILISSFVSFIASIAFGPLSSIASRSDLTKIITWFISFAGGCALTVMTYENSYLERITQLNNENIGNTLTLSAIGITLLYDLLKVK